MNLQERVNNDLKEAKEILHKKGMDSGLKLDYLQRMRSKYLDWSCEGLENYELMSSTYIKIDDMISDLLCIAPSPWSR